MLKFSKALLCFRTFGASFFALYHQGYIDKKHGETYNLLFDVILSLSEVLLYLRASGASSLRSITGAIERKNNLMEIC